MVLVEQQQQHPRLLAEDLTVEGDRLPLKGEDLHLSDRPCEPRELVQLAPTIVTITCYRHTELIRSVLDEIRDSLVGEIFLPGLEEFFLFHSADVE
eukprot:CAMPEP_0170551638 /NCGR_PEP_ID=MMETSP0211-20121228/9654_1 /TAXON_ID=311385 /ORGANISM="Pseudokeronopsis sp., Strain OXSARD2" /LENGTH=95 /DNA_ID=CAMNT_0010858949 /DNA_START=156 /DNA_END=440 /DNA_ORIENTATION=+